MTTLVSLYSPTAMPAGVMVIEIIAGNAAVPWRCGRELRQLHSAPYREPSACTATPVLRLWFVFGWVRESLTGKALG